MAKRSFFMSTLTPEQISEFSDKWLKGTLSGEELRLFEEWYNQQPPDSVSWKPDATEVRLRRRMFSEITGRLKEEGRMKGGPVRMRGWIAAASILVLLVAGGLLWSRFSVRNGIAAVPSVFSEKDLAPGGNRATLTLGDGSVITLDSSAATGVLALQGRTKISRSASGQLVYDMTGVAAGSSGADLFYNTISTARGGQYQLRLADGTVVWLNAASSLRFPTAFTGKERVVELKGEAFFEVAKNADMPFRVKINEAAAVEVLGTQFDLNTYEDEHMIRTTLLEGSVRMKNGSSSSLLTPGQQAQWSGTQRIRVADDINTEEVVAWKNNRFYFKSADIHTIMRQLSRWYDVDVEYIHDAADAARYNAEIPRNTYASDILKALELTGKVKFRIEGKKIIVDAK